MPTFPRILPQPHKLGVPGTPNFPRPINPVAGLVDAAGEVANVFQRVQDGADRAELESVTSRAKVSFDDVLLTNKTNVQDPKQYSEDANRALTDAHKSILDSTTNPRVKRAVEIQLAGDLADAQIKIRHEALAKTKDQGLAKMEDALSNYETEATNAPDRASSDAIYKKGGELIGYMQGQSFLSAETAQKRREKFHDTVTASRIKQQSAELQQTLGALINNANTSPAAADELFKFGEASIAGLGDDVPLAKRQEMKSKFKDALYTGAIEGRIERDPLGADKDLRAGAYNDVIDQQSLRFLKNKASSELDRLARQDEAQRKQSDKLIGKQVADFEAAAMHGFQWSGNLAQLRESAKGTEHEEKLNETLRDSQVLLAFNQYGPVAQEQYLRSQAQTAKSGADAKLYGKLETAHRATVEGLKNDAITYAIRQRAIPTVSAFDLNNPNSLKERSVAAGMVEQRYGVTGVSPLSDDEAQGLAGQFAKAPAAEQVAMLGKLRGFEDRHLKGIAAQIARKKDDPVLAFAIGLTSDNPAAAERILRGREIMRDNKEIMPKGADLKTAQDNIASALGEAFKNNPEHYAAVSDAVMTIYAFKSWQDRDLSGVINSRRLRDAITEASGGVIKVGSSTIQPVRPGMTEDQFMSLVRGADYSKARLSTYEGRPVVKNPDGSWSHERSMTIEAGGNHMNIPTMFGGKEVRPADAIEIMRKNNWVDPDNGQKVQTFKTQAEAVKAAQEKERRQQGFKPTSITPADIAKHGTFESVGEGRYLIKIGPGYVQGEKGPFILDLNFAKR